MKIQIKDLKIGDHITFQILDIVPMSSGHVTALVIDSLPTEGEAIFTRDVRFPNDAQMEVKER